MEETNDMFKPEFPIAETDGIKHLFIDVKMSDYFEYMHYDVVNGHRDYHYDNARTFVTEDDGRFCVLINKRNGCTSGWINYSGWYEEMYFMSVVLKNSIRPLFKDQDEFMTFAAYIEPSVRLSFKENGFNEDTDDETILNNILLQHIPVTIVSVDPLQYKLNAFYVKSIARGGEKYYNWNAKMDRIPIKTHDFVQTFDEHDEHIE